MDFYKYPKIQNGYDPRAIRSLRGAGFDKDIDWIVTEKIHGANFSIRYDRKSKRVRYASRNGILGENANFYNHKKIVSRYNEAIAEALLRFDFMNSIAIFGELFGGHYPKADRNNDVSKVQKGVCYSPDIEFAAFDVMVDGNYLPFEEMARVLEYCGIPTVPFMHKGTFDECLEFNDKFHTQVSRELGYPDIEGNYCEGIVIRPEVELDGSKVRYMSRVMLKSKNEAYKEKASEPKQPQSTAGGEAIQEWVDAVSCYMVFNRFLNVASKLGDLDEEPFEKIVGIFTHDAMQDAFDELVGVDKLSKHDIRAVRRKVKEKYRDQIANWVDEYTKEGKENG